MSLIHCDSLICTDTFGGALSVWIRLPTFDDWVAGTGAGTGFDTGQTFVIDIGDNNFSFFVFTLTAQFRIPIFWTIDCQLELRGLAGDARTNWPTQGENGIINVNSIGLNFGGWNWFFVTYDMNHQGPGQAAGPPQPVVDPKIGWVYLNRAPINRLGTLGNLASTPLNDGLISTGGPSGPYTPSLSGKQCDIPGTAFERDNSGSNFNTEFAIYQFFNRYIEPTEANLDVFSVVRDGKIYPRGGSVATSVFGTPVLWLDRDNVSGVKFEENQGSGGNFAVVGTALTDYSPGPQEGIPVVA